MTVAGGGAGRSPVCPSSGPRRLGWLSSGARGAGCRRMRGIRSWRRSVTRLSRSPTSGCPGLPSALSEIPLEVAVEGADELRSHGVPGRVGIVGMSRGSELALLAAAQSPERFGAAVGIAPSGVVNAGYGPDGPGGTSGWTLNGEAVPYLPRRNTVGDHGREHPRTGSDPGRRQRSGVALLRADRSCDATAPAVVARRRRPGSVRRRRTPVLWIAGIPVMGPLDSQVHPVSGKPYRAGGTRRGDAMARDRSWVELIRIAAHLSDEAARYPPRD